jgi:high affinity Mn2+ porin
MRRTALLTLLLWLTVPSAAQAQSAAEPPNPTEATTLFPRPDDGGRWWLSGQLNVIWQRHGSFPSPYQGDHSLLPDVEHATSRVWTLYTGLRLPRRTEILVDIESAGGGGISDALGLAGFTNLDVVRNPTLGSAPYLARLMVHHTISLGSKTIKTTSGPLSLESEQPATRLELRAGKLSIVDFFDLSTVGSDSHLQFINWTIDNNGAYDYAADTRGYTWGAIVDYITPAWSVRGAVALMPKVANGIDLDWDLRRARGENLEIDWRPSSAITVRALGYVNHANMGSYDEAIQAFHDGTDPRPDIEAHRRQGRVKYGTGTSLDYVRAGGVRLYGRAGWNEGTNESFAYTEVNNTGQAGGDVDGVAWHRGHDRVGAAVVTNGLSTAHREYLRLGGLGFLLGDGTLTYGRECIVESYYTAQVWRGITAALDVQRVANPGYNHDRGPALVLGVRLHVDF